MKELLTYIVKNLVSEPDAIAITEEIDGDNVTFSLRVAPGDMGRVIGRHGRIAKEIRTLMKAAGNQAHDGRYSRLSLRSSRRRVVCDTST